MTGRDEAGRFLPGNRLWEARSSAGPKPTFADGEALWAACVEYFEFVEANPLQEAKAFAHEGKVTIAPLPKMRAMTIGALCVFLDVTEKSWRNWRDDRPDLLPVITRVEAIIRAQKFEGASAGLLDPRIIARDLGLADRQELTGRDGGPIQTEDVTADAAEFTGRLSRLAAAAAARAGNGEVEPGGEGGA